MQTQIALSEEQVLWPVRRDYQLILSTEGMLIDQKSYQTVVKTLIWPGISEKPRAEVVVISIVLDSVYNRY